MKNKILLLLLLLIIAIPFKINASDDECETKKTVSDAGLDYIFGGGNIRDYFHDERYPVNDELCRLYCREDLYFNFYDMVSTKAGQTFEYDLRELMKRDKERIQEKVTAFFDGTKECTTVIYMQNFEDKYSAANQEVINTWTNFKKAESLLNVTRNGQNVSTANVKDPVEEILTLECKCSWLKTRNLIIGEDEQGRPIRDNVTVCAGSDDNGSISYFYRHWKEDYNSFSGGRTIWVGGDISGNSAINEFTWGRAECVGASQSECSCNAGTPTAYEQNIEDAKKIIVAEYNTAKAAYMEAIKTREQLILDLESCNFYSDGKVNANKREEIDGIPVNASYNDVKGKIISDYPELFASCSSVEDEYNIEYGKRGERHDKEYGDTPLLEYKYYGTGSSVSYCARNGTHRGTTLCKSSSELQSEPLEQELIYYECSGTYGNARCEAVKRKVPVNNMADVKTSAEMYIYQSQIYFNHVYSGVVTPESPMPGIANVQLDEYTYPVSLNTPTGKYKVNLNYSCVGDDDINRPQKWSEKLKDSKYTCYVLVENETIMDDCEDNCCYDNTCPPPDECDGPCSDEGFTLGFIYRTINLNNIFPSGMEKRGINWKTGLGPQVKSTIEKYNTSIWSNNDHLEYSFRLTPQNRKNIIEYNHSEERPFNAITGAYTGAGYLNNTLERCTITQDKEFTNCISGFLMNGESNDYFTGGKVSHGGKLQ